MANWVHCNKCFEQLQKTKNVKFFLTECGHIVCEKCSDHIKVSTACIVCNKRTEILQLSKEMDPSYRSFFSPVENQIKKCLEIYNFQNNHKESFYSNFHRKYEYAKQECMKHYLNNKKLIQENKMLRAMLRNSGGQSRPISSTPTGNNHNSAYFQNVSVSTISPKKMFAFGSHIKNDCPNFTPAKNIPGFAHRLSTSKLSNQSSVSHGISPVQVVPMEGGPKPFAPIHRAYLGPMSSMQELQRATRFTKA